MLEPVLAGDGVGHADLGGAVGLEHDRAPPLDDRPLHVDRARGAGQEDELHRRDVVRRPLRSRQGGEPGQVGGHHGGRPDLPALDRAEHVRGVEPGSRPTGVPAARARTALSGPVWCSGATTRWRPSPTNAVGLRGLDELGPRGPHREDVGREVGGLRAGPVVPEVKSRFGTIGTSSGGGPAGAAASQRPSPVRPTTGPRTGHLPGRGPGPLARSPGPAITSATSPTSSW